MRRAAEGRPTPRRPGGTHRWDQGALAVKGGCGIGPCGHEAGVASPMQIRTTGVSEPGCGALLWG